MIPRSPCQLLPAISSHNNPRDTQRQRLKKRKFHCSTLCPSRPAKRSVTITSPSLPSQVTPRDSHTRLDFSWEREVGRQDTTTAAGRRDPLNWEESGQRKTEMKRVTVWVMPPRSRSGTEDTDQKTSRGKTNVRKGRLLEALLFLLGPRSPPTTQRYPHSSINAGRNMAVGCCSGHRTCPYTILNKTWNRKNSYLGA